MNQSTGKKPPGFSLLLVDDERVVLALLKEIFISEPYRVAACDTARKAMRMLASHSFDAAIVDLNLPDMDGLALLKEIRFLHPETAVIILTGVGGVREAVKAMKGGAVDFLEKPVRPVELQQRVARIAQSAAAEEERRKLKRETVSLFKFGPLVGQSAPILKLKSLIVRVGPTDATVLIEGETGTGKELVAKAIHHHSQRAGGVFVPVDCAAIGETVIESELFGHVKGAFTGAHKASDGLMRSADGGTLFLDEIGELALNLQTKLLRTIQERQVRPIGSSCSCKVDVRIIAATNRDLSEEAALGRFRDDLLYRLNVVNIHVPPLRERREDIPLLANYFLERFKTALSPVKSISKDALDLLAQQEWRGNVRELENSVRRAVALGRYPEVRPQDLALTEGGARADDNSLQPLVMGDAFSDYERAAIENALEKSMNNRRKAAELLQIGEATLYRKLRKYDIAAID